MGLLNILFREKRSNMKQWRVKLEWITLPSGLRVGVRKVELTDLVAQGGIPVSLLGLAKELEAKGVKTADDVVASGMLDDMEKFQEHFAIYDVIVRATVVEPRIGEQPADDVLGINEIPFRDKQFIFEWANEGADKLRSFRKGEGES